MISRADLEVVRAAFSAWGDRGDFNRALDEHFAHDVVYRDDPIWPGSGSYRGLEAVKVCFREYRRTLRFNSALVERVMAGDDSIVALVRLGVQWREASEQVTHLFGYVCRVGDGKVTEFQAYIEPAAALEAAGVTSHRERSPGSS